MPFSNWANLHDLEPENYTLLAKDKENVCKSCAQVAYERISKSIPDVFGYPDYYKRVVKAQSKLERLEIKFATTKDRIFITDIELAKIDLELISKNKPSEFSYWSMFFDLENALGRNLDRNEETIFSVYTRCKDLEKQSNAQRANEKAA